MTQPRAADDFTEIRKRMEELRRAEGRPGVINVAGPAGNPTQPTGDPKTPKGADPPGTCKHDNGWDHVADITYKCKLCGKQEVFYDD
jgi:hypothetical protein